jgi:serine-type D-Ala-D-Ala carboxypeptidase/endopeptidase
MNTTVRLGTRLVAVCGATMLIVSPARVVVEGAPGHQKAPAVTRTTPAAGEIERLLAASVNNLGGGCSLLLVQGGQVIYDRSFGGADGARPVRIASATKWLTGAVMMSLVDSGALRLDDLAARYLPGLTGDAARITIRQLLSHTSGLPMAHPALQRRDLTLAEAVDAIIATPLTYPPGQACVYGDVSVQVAGRVAEIASGKNAASGQAWTSLAASRLLEPLEMTATSFVGEASTNNPVLAGGAVSTAQDYSHFLTMLLNRGTFRGHRVLSEAAVAEMLRDQTGGAPLRFNLFESFPELCPDWRHVRYGICAWLETTDRATGRAKEASSPGIFGFIPWIDVEQNLAGILVASAAPDKTLPVYLRLKALLRARPR